MLGPSVKCPFGTLALAPPSTLRTVSKLMPYLFSTRRIQFDSHAGQRAAAHRHLADAGDLRQLLRHDGRSRVVHLAFGQHIRSQPDDEDRRIGGIDFAVAGIAGQIRRQIAARRIDGRFHVARGGVDIAVRDRTAA